MARIHGKGGEITIDSSNAVGHIQNWTLDVQGKTDEAYSMGDDWTDNEVTYKSASGNFEVYMDDSDAGQIACEVGGQVAMNLYPDTNTSGKKYRTGTVKITAIQENGNKDGFVSRTINWVNTSGGITEQTVT